MNEIREQIEQLQKDAALCPPRLQGNMLAFINTVEKLLIENKRLREGANIEHAESK